MLNISKWLMVLLLTLFSFLLNNHIYSQQNLTRSQIDSMIARGASLMNLKEWDDAATWYEIVLRNDPDNLEANYNYAICKREKGRTTIPVLRLLIWRSSRKHFGHVIALDSTFKDVFYQYALLEQYRKHYFKSIELIHRQLAINETIERAQIDIFKLYDYLLYDNPWVAENWLKSRHTKYDGYFLGELYRRAGKFSKADSIFQMILSNPGNLPLQPVFLSLVRMYVQKNEPQKAYDTYWQAVEAVSNNVEAELLLEDFMYIINEHEYKLITEKLIPAMIPDVLRMFWMRRDLMPAMPYNTRLIEHYRRLIYAEKNFRCDGFNDMTYKTMYQTEKNIDSLNVFQFPEWYYKNNRLNDMGLIYIRFGEPDEQSFALSKDGDPSDPIKHWKAIQGGLPKNISWIYYKKEDSPKMIFHFTEPKYAPISYWILIPGFTQKEIIANIRHWDVYLHSGKMHLYFNDRVNDVKLAFQIDRHTFPKKTKELEMYYDVFKFRVAENIDLLQLSYAIPLIELLDERLEQDSIQFEVGAAIFDDRMNPIFKDLRDFVLKDSSDSHVFNGYFIDEFEFPLAPNRHNIAIHGRVPQANKVMGWQFNYNLMDSARDRLACSSLKLAFQISPTTKSDIHDRSLLKIIPNPGKKFNKGFPLYAYYEIYNLSLDETGMTNYTLNFKIKQVGFEDNVFKKITGIFRSRKKYQEITIKNDLGRNDQTVTEYISFDVNNLILGHYELILDIKDNVTGEETFTRANFELRTEK